MNFGQNDFIQYWAAFQLHLRGADAYDPNLVLAVEKARGWSEVKPLMMWNPPWLLALLSPILQLDFKTSANAFLVLNIFLILFSLVILRTIYKFKYLPLLLFLFPLFLCLKLGQVSILILFATSVLLYGLLNSKDLLVGIALSILTIKPQLLFLPLLAMLFFIERKRVFKIILSTFISLGSLVSLLWLQNSNTIFNWLERSRHNSNPKLLSVYSWKTTTLSTLIRDGIFNVTGKFTIWPMYAVSLILALSLLLYLKKNRNVELKNMWPILIPLSCFTTPFGWIYDSAVCLISQAWLFSKPLDKLKLSIVCLLQGVMFLQFYINKSSYYSYWYFYPIYILILWQVRRDEQR